MPTLILPPTQSCDSRALTLAPKIWNAVIHRAPTPSMCGALYCDIECSQHSMYSKTLFVGTFEPDKRRHRPPLPYISNLSLVEI